MKRPLVIDLFCGLGGWTDGFLSEGYDAIGFDIEKHDYGNGGYPGQLVIQDVLTLDGRQFQDANVIVASPPCQAYSYRAMPWKRAKMLPPPDNALFEACFRIAREAGVPLIVENVCGAQKWVGRAAWHYGSFYLWGDVPAVRPIVTKKRWKFPADCGPRMWSEREYMRLNDGNASAFHHEGATKNDGGSWFAVAHNTGSGHGRNPVNGIKTVGHVNKRDGYSHTRHLTNQSESDGVKHHGSGPVWFDTGPASHGSKSNSCKAASAQIAKIPFDLSVFIARTFKNRCIPK